MYAKLWQDGIENTASVNRITRATRANGDDDDNIANERSRANNESQPPESREECGKQFAVERIVGHDKFKDGYVIACDGISTAPQMIRMNLRHTSRRASSIVTRIGRLETRRAVHWQNGKAITKRRKINYGERANQKTR